MASADLKTPTLRTSGVEPCCAAVHRSSLPKNPDGSLNMKPFYSYLPTGKYRDEMLKYSDLSVLLGKLKYNAFFNRFAEDRLLRGSHDGDFRLRFSQARLKVVWGPDSNEDEINAYRIIVLLMLVRYSLMRHETKPAGYEWHYLKRCVTVFSAPNYANSNAAAVALVSERQEGAKKRTLRIDLVMFPS